ncbi:hypothetical protein [Paenibacillus sp. HJGM_3]|uniref:hypothetical protein n=1 Tax=Paenibacillus sp. HJGM_3 TaxID=3379816 RepID=UPI00385F4DBD
MAEESNDTSGIARRLGRDKMKELVNVLADQLSGSELNSLLLEVYRSRTGAGSAAELLRRYRDNRFVKPAVVDPIDLRQLELDVLRIARQHGFTPVQLSPVAPIGSCSIVATADQNKIISATRGTEVVADATNLLALHVSEGLQNGSLDNRACNLHFCTTHRHVRAQQVPKAPGMFAHFQVLCLVSSGIDRGSYSFEIGAFWEHIRAYRDIFHTRFDSEIEIILNARGGYKNADDLVQRIRRAGEEQSIPVRTAINPAKTDNRYYQGLQFTIKTTIQGKDHYIGDGGFVDWTQQLRNNRKERFLISAIGLERLLLL